MKDKTGWFWFGKTDNGNKLIVRLEQKELRPLIPSDAEKGVKGQVRMRSQGWLEFRSKVDVPSFLEELAAWMKQHNGQYKQLDILKGTRFVVKQNKQVIAKYKNDQVWL